MTPRHAILIALAALAIGACAPTAEPATITPTPATLCLVVDAGRLREVPC